MSSEKKKVEMIRVPWGSWFRFIVFVASIFLAIGNFWLLLKFWKICLVPELLFSKAREVNLIYNTLILPWFLIQYCTIGLVFVCLVAWIKKGFCNLRPIKSRDGVRLWFTIGFTACLITCVGSLIFILPAFLFGLSYHKNLIIGTIVFLILEAIVFTICLVYALVCDELKN